MRVQDGPTATSVPKGFRDADRTDGVVGGTGAGTGTGAGMTERVLRGDQGRGGGRASGSSDPRQNEIGAASL